MLRKKKTDSNVNLKLQNNPVERRLEFDLTDSSPSESIIHSKINSNSRNNEVKLPDPSLSATEIHCQEQSKGGLKFDVILADPAGTPPAPKRTQSPTRTKSVENIEKLKAAEERRLSLEANMMATISAKLSQIKEASNKMDERISVFINQRKEALDQKMEMHREKREALFSDIKSKLKDHEDEKIFHTLEQQTLEVCKEVELKLTHVSAQRDEVFKKIVHRLEEHDEQVKKAASNRERIRHLQNQIQTKLEQASLRLINLENEQLEQLRNMDEQVKKVAASNRERIRHLQNQIQTKLELAYLRRINLEKEHLEQLMNMDEQVKKVAASNRERIRHLQNQIQTKLEQASLHRINLEKEQLEQLMNMDEQVKKVAASKRERIRHLENQIQTKLEQASLRLINLENEQLEQLRNME